MALVPASRPSPELRAAYLDTLSEPQELHVESLVATGQTFVHGESAYAVVNRSTLVELHATPGDERELLAVFRAVLAGTGATDVLCKSFDTRLLLAALSKDATVRTGGLLFRRCVEPLDASVEGARVRLATRSDVEDVLAVGADFFDDETEVVGYLESDGLFVLEREGRIDGCGVGRVVIPGRDAVDVGMVVSPDRRRQGLGSHLVAAVKEHYLRRGFRPICGCGADNVASRRALERAGFVAEHRLFVVSYTG